MGGSRLNESTAISTLTEPRKPAMQRVRTVMDDLIIWRRKKIGGAASQGLQEVIGEPLRL